MALALYILLAVALTSLFVLWRFWNPRRFKAFMNKQGLKGSDPRWSSAENVIQEVSLREEKRLKGMEYSGVISHDIVAHVTPEVTLRSSLYGKPYYTWWFSEPRITVFDPESFREILSKQYDNFSKSKEQLEFLRDLMGRGLVGVNGDEWSHQRRFLTPAFHVEKLKRMVPSVQACTERTLKSWKLCLERGENEVDVFKEITTLTADIVSRTAFGSSYSKGELVFQGLQALGVLLNKCHHFSWLPFYRYHPTPLNLQIWRLTKEIDGVLLSLIHERRNLVKLGEVLSHGNDLLGLILEESEKGGIDDQVLVDECKTFYLAGHETTTSLLSWTLLLLALHPEWQERARAEIQEHGFQDSEALGRLKVVGMILYETLRLYPPVPETERAANKDTVLNGLKIPKGTGVGLPILSLHHDKDLWGDDVNEFKPERFSQGAAKASVHPNAFVPFIFGPRVCIGQTFAIMEAKMVISMLLTTFSFRVSPSYRHNPTTHVLLVPDNGIQLLIERIHPHC